MTDHRASGAAPDGTTERGAGLAEYAFLLLLVLVACVGSLTLLGPAIAAAIDLATGMF